MWVHPKGGIYFSDPYYQRPYWDHQSPTQDGKHVYYLSADYKKLLRVTTDLIQPNGVIGTPDGKVLYVSDFSAKKVYKYKINKDGTLSDKTLFCDYKSDGMTIDCCGNVYLTSGPKVLVVNKAGELIKEIPVPQKTVANITFSGVKNNRLFITAGKGVYTLQMNVCGVR